MKINKYTFILPIIFCILLYLLGAFIGWEFNPKEWDIVGRFFISFLFIISTVFGMMMAEDIK